MKRLAWFSIVFMLCIGLTGCTYSSMNLIRAQGGELKANYQLINSASGKDVAITIFRQMFVTTKELSKVPEVPTLPDLKESVGKFQVKNEGSK